MNAESFYEGTLHWLLWEIDWKRRSSGCLKNIEFKKDPIETMYHSIGSGTAEECPERRESDLSP